MGGVTSGLTFRYEFVFNQLNLCGLLVLRSSKARLKLRPFQISDLMLTNDASIRCVDGILLGHARYWRLSRTLEADR